MYKISQIFEEFIKYIDFPDCLKKFLITKINNN